LHVFDTSDPNIVFSPNSLLKKLRINLFYLATGVNTEPYIASVRRHQLESSLCSIDPSLRLDQITEPLTIDDHLKLEPSPQSSITFNSIERLKETFGRMQTEIECLRSNAQKHDSEIQYLRAQCSSLLKERDKFTEHLDLLFERSDALISRSLSKRLNESEAIFAAAEISLPTKHGEPSEQPSPPTTLFVSHNASRTGAPICLIDFISWLKSNTTMKFKIILKEGGPITTRFQQLGECFFFDDEWNNRHDESTFRQRLIEFCPNADLIYANTIASFDVLEHLKYLDAPLLTHVHELESVIQEFVGEKFIELEQFTDYFLCASPAVRENLKHHHNIADVNSGTLYSPIAVDTNYDGNNKEKLRISLGLDPSLTYVVSCGTIEWRKGPDLFVECAKILADRGLKDIQFLWIGEFFDNEYSNLDKELSLTNLGDMVKFLGLRDNARDYFAACDIFLLPSREDPFPLVCLEAAEKQLPILCFADAGSMPDFVEKDAGYFVPYEDTEALASCIQNLAENVNLRTQLGKRARQKILERHDVEKATPHLLRVMHWVAHIHPKVSVIVPNYNHADYLIERLDSIFSQTYRNFEVIILDDCSSDDSIKLIERYVKHPLVRMVKNPHNSGNVFVQWLQGLRLARGELIWIAESDDFCKNNFLERLVPVFSDPSMALAYCQSLPVDAQGRHAGEFDYLSYTKDLSESKWTANYCCTGIEEVNHGLAVKNTIPNVSAVLSRKPNINRLEKDIVQFTVSGDWYYYLNLLTNGKITFIADTLNFHRRHSHSVVAQHEASTIHFSDISRIHRFILDNFSISNYTKKRMLQQVKNEWMRHHQDSNFDELLVSYSKEVYDELTGADRDSISILIVVSDLNFGGGQIAAIRLANALLKAKHRIYLLNVGAHAEEKQVRNMLSPEITVFSTNEWTSPMADFRSLIVENEIQVINSHIWWADKFVATHLGELETAWVITMHGCYEHLLHDELCDPEFTSLAPQLLDRADSIIYIADKNLEVFDHFSLSNPDKLKKVYTGFEPQTPRAINKNELGIDEGSFIAGIVSRAIPEKGWEQAIKAIELLNADLPNPIHLILIGESEYSQTLAARHHNSKNIHFIGFTESPLNYIQLFDVGLLPTYFDSESLPNSVVEYLACDKPVIATAMGEIKNMIMTKKGIAGQIVNFDLQGKADTKQLVKLIEKYVKNPDYLSTHSLLAKTAFEKFSMQNCIEKYSGVFQTLIASKNPHS
jgi:glycosyltransferase involved in cell wall biosynthesis